MTGESFATGKTVLEQPGHEVLVIGQSHQTVSNVARRQHTEVAAQATRRAAVVAHRYHGLEVGDLAPHGLLETAEQHRQPAPSADRDQLGAAFRDHVRLS
jgi:hypothetical protein